MRLSKTLISCVAMTAVTAVSEVASAESYTTLSIVNNFDPTTPSGSVYFGANITNDNIWVANVDNVTPGAVLYGGPTVARGGKGMDANKWYKLSEILDTTHGGDGKVYIYEAEPGEAGYRMVAAIFYPTALQTGPYLTPTGIVGTPTVTTCSGSGATEVSAPWLAYQLFEYNLDPTDPNCDLSNVDSFYFPTRVTVTTPGGTTVASGFADGILAEAVINRLDNAGYGGNNGFGYYPVSTPPFNCYTGLTTCWTAVDVGNAGDDKPQGAIGVGTSPYRPGMPHVTQNGMDFYYLQCFEQYQEFFDNLYSFQGGATGEGIYFTCSENHGFSFYAKLVPNFNHQNCKGATANSQGYSLMLYNFQQLDNFTAPYQNGTASPVTGSLTIAADGYVFSDSNIANTHPGSTYYGLWTTGAILAGINKQTSVSGDFYTRIWPTYRYTSPDGPTTTVNIPATSKQNLFLTLTQDQSLTVAPWSPGPKTCTAFLSDDAVNLQDPYSIVMRWNSWDTTQRNWTAMLSTAIGRVATAFIGAMNMKSTSWNQLSGNEGFAYVSALISASSTPVSVQSAPQCQPSIPSLPPGGKGTAFFQCGPDNDVPFGSPYYYQMVNGNGPSNPFVLEGDKGLPPYLFPYGDNFTSKDCATVASAFSPDIPVTLGPNGSGSTIKWEIGVLGTQATCDNQPQCSTQLWSDINDDGATDGSDVTLLLQAWGTNQQAFDFDSSGVVDSQDLSRLLSHLGDSALLATIAADPIVPEWATLSQCCPPQEMCKDLREMIAHTGFAWKVIDNTTGMDMVLIPAGTFDMGCTPSTGVSWLNPCTFWEKWRSGETRKLVQILDNFYMGEFEVTQAVYKRIMSTNPSYFTSATNLPVENVSYNDIAGPGGFLAKVNDGDADVSQMRLPTEPEWEYACRAQPPGYLSMAFSSTLNLSATGDGANCLGTDQDATVENLAWCAQNSNGTTHPNNPMYANGFGLSNMLGNVWEWTDTQFNGPYNPDPAPANSNYVLRGGYYSNQINNTMYPFQITNFVRSSYRGSAAATDKGNDNGQRGRFGFRVVRTAVPPPPPQLED